MEFIPISNSIMHDNDSMNISCSFKSLISLAIEKVELILVDSDENRSYSMDLIQSQSNFPGYLERLILAWMVLPISMYDDGKPIFFQVMYKTNSVKFYFSGLKSSYYENAVISGKTTYYNNVYFGANVQVEYQDEVIFYGAVSSESNVRIIFRSGATYYSTFMINGIVTLEESLTRAKFEKVFDRMQVLLSMPYPLSYFGNFNSML